MAPGLPRHDLLHEFFGGVVDHWEFQIIDEDSGPDEPEGDGHKLCPCEFRNHEVVRDPKQMQPLRVQKNYKENVFPGPLFAVLVDVQNRGGDKSRDLGVIHEDEQEPRHIRGIEQTISKEPCPHYISREPVEVNELPQKQDT